MDKIKNIITAAVSVTGGILSSCLGLLLPWTQLMLGAVLLDYLTGMAAAAYLGRLSSRVGIKGIFKKLAIVCMVAVGMITDRVILEGSMVLGIKEFPQTTVALTVIIWIIINELISILENLGRMEVRLPAFLHSIIQSLHSAVDRDNNLKG